MNFEKIRERINDTAILLDVDQTRMEVHKILEHGNPGGISTGWAELDQFFQFPPTGQLNLIAGTPGSGKSEWLDSLALNVAIDRGWKIFAYSPENYPASFYLQKLCEKFVGKPFFGHDWNCTSMDARELDGAIDFIKNHFTFVDCHINNSSIDQILNSIFDECIENRIQMAIIDPWNKLENQKPKGMNNTEYIGQALTRIQMFSRQRDISFWIAAHPAKPMRLKNGSFSGVTLYDVSDSAHWYNMIDNGFIISRTWEDKVGYKNRATLKIAKIKDRRYGKCGEIEFKFSPATGRFEAVDIGDGVRSSDDLPEW